MYYALFRHELFSWKNLYILNNISGLSFRFFKLLDYSTCIKINVDSVDFTINAYILLIIIIPI